ncbi:MAG: N-acetyltransferase [Anaerolineales bacterium]|nr:GNAT family N-acetyltransferase [Anaerolineae bacterium]PWB71025.1 MAG: N-acetyltransferase [Anaerolineales bacterium]
MNYTFVPMSREFASTIINTWKYENEYSIYDYSNEADHMLDEDGWGNGIFAVLNQDGELIGELSIEFFDEQGQYTDYLNFGDETLINQRELWIGFGLRPDLVGKGHGTDFVTACVEFAVENYHYHGEYIRLGVAKFNQRAIKTYNRVGFQEFNQTTGAIAGRMFEVIHMRKSI